MKERDFELAEQLLREALEVTEPSVGVFHESTCATLFALGTVLFQQRKFAGAKAAFAKSLVVREQIRKMFEEFDWQLHLSLGGTCAELGESDQSGQVLRRGGED